jgi:hypothetical protein
MTERSTGGVYLGPVSRCLLLGQRAAVFRRGSIAKFLRKVVYLWVERTQPMLFRCQYLHVALFLDQGGLG